MALSPLIEIHYKYKLMSWWGRKQKTEKVCLKHEGLEVHSLYTEEDIQDAQRLPDYPKDTVRLTQRYELFLSFECHSGMQRSLGQSVQE